MNDPYFFLDVARDAEPGVIKHAYRKLAKKYHPDRNPGDLETEQRFKEITEAYHLLSNQKTGHDDDRGRLDSLGQPKQPPSGQNGGSRQKEKGRHLGLGTMFNRMFGKFGRAGNGRTRGDPEQPPESSTARGDGQSRSDRNGKQGDLLVHVRVFDHPLFTRRGQDMHLDLPVSLKEALLGGRVRTPTIEGAVWLNIPAHANSGQMLRLKGRGVADRTGKRGDQLVRLMVMLPKNPGAALAADLGRLARHDEDDDVRAHLDRY